MLKVDLHTHSVGSPDGGISPEQYADLLENHTLDFIAVTDHDNLEVAAQLHESFGERIIVGEEITTSEGELIGLFLTEPIKPGMSAMQTVQAIKKQGGIVYVPHPFETVRKGISTATLDSLADLVDIVEVYNGRALVQNRGPEAITWARINGKATAASSDAHGTKGVGTAYSLIKSPPTASNLAEQLRLAHHHMERPPLKTLLYPKANRVLKRLGRK